MKTKSQKQELSVAKDLKARTTAASGALWGQKGDVRADKYLVECKTTAQPSYRLTLATWNKIKKEAIKDGLRIPIMCIELNNDTSPDKYAVFEFNDLKDYPRFYELCSGYSIHTQSTSFLVSIVHSGTQMFMSGTSFEVMKWSDFLELIKE